MGKASRDKGKRGEREFAKFLTAHGFPARRGVQYQGGPDSPDVVGLPGWHIECKRVERVNLYAALAQADAERADEDKPVVFHRRNRGKWTVYLDAEDFLALLREIRALRCECGAMDVCEHEGLP